jgi:membrane-associated phospholipid phosphatase
MLTGVAIRDACRLKHREPRLVPFSASYVFLLTVFCILLAMASLTYASPYQTSSGRETTFFASGGLLYLGGAIKASNNTAPTVAELENLNRENVPAFDRAYVGRWDPDFEKLSDVFLASSLVFPTALMLSNRNDAKTLGLMYAETLVLATGGVNLSKGVAQRYRPFVYGYRAPLRYRLEKDAKRSFFSGHAAEIASSLVFTAKVYSDYHPDSRYQPYVWGVAIIGAISGSWLRVEAGLHFPSDAVAGMLWGGLIGYAVPALHHKNQTRVSIIPFVHDGQRGAIIVKQF